MRTQWASFIERQHQYPTGIAGRIVGERMIRQHAPETRWSCDLLSIQPRDRVIELGCGAGRGLVLAAERAYQGHVTGVDLSATMLRSAARRNRQPLTEARLALIRADVASLPFAGQHWDKIWSIHTFYFWPNPLTDMMNFASLLAVGGRLVIAFATAETRPTGERVFWPLHERAHALVHELQHQAGLSVHLEHGPDSRQFNNVAIVIDRE